LASVTKVALGALLAALASGAQPVRLSVEDVLRIAVEAVAGDNGDEETAEELKHAALSERLGDEPVEIIRKSGVGPRTLSALEELKQESAGLPLPKTPTALLQPVPEPSQQQEMIQKMSAYASTYIHSLPNFLCVETTRFFQSGKAGKNFREGDRGSWRLDQTVTEELRYHGGAEEYQTQKVDDKPSHIPIRQLRSSFSRGEFGTVLGMTFEPASAARLDWDHWETIDHRRLTVFRFDVDRAHSLFRVCCISTGERTVNGVRKREMKEWVAAYRGLVYADPESGVIERFSFQNVDIPEGYNIDDARTLVEFSPVSIDERVAWLPRKAIHYARKGGFRSRDEITFSNYRSFAARATIQFPTETEPDPAPTPPPHP